MFDNIEKYIEATSGYLGVQSERYGSGYRAIIGLHSDVTFLTDVLTDPGQGAVQVQYFLGGNPVFPASFGKTVTEALEQLDLKLGILYEFQQDKTGQWECHKKFSIKAQCDSEPGESPEFYDVNWFDVVADLREAYQKEGDAYFYETAEDTCGIGHYRNLHALLNLDLPEGIKSQLKNCC